MTDNVIFTICAKNYMAQALTLRESTHQYNHDDFFIFLADSIEDLAIDGLIELSEKWIPDWEQMAFKYDVIEFNTSIKPFCIKRLMDMGYHKIIYLDPDIYVTDKLNYVWEHLENYSIQLTPHYCDCVEHFNGAVDEETFMCAGIFNLGFCAIKNNDVGKEIVRWWMNRLMAECYSDRSKGMFVDQKWMDFIPAFFPKETHISHHLGMNVAIWNLHERTLETQGLDYYIRSNRTGEVCPLLFFHFSGFDPFDKHTINRRHPQYNIQTYPSFQPIVEEYRHLIYKNNYEKYKNKSYAFDSFDDGEPIIPLQRRLYREYIEKGKHPMVKKIFAKDTDFYYLLSRKGVIAPKTQKTKESVKITIEDKNKGFAIEKKYIWPLLRTLIKYIGVKRYSMLIHYAARLGRKEYHYFLIQS